MSTLESTESVVFQAIESGGSTSAEIIDKTEFKRTTVQKTLRRLVNKNRVERLPNLMEPRGYVYEPIR